MEEGLTGLRSLTNSVSAMPTYHRKTRDVCK